jgi:hypothetical protein
MSNRTKYPESIEAYVHKYNLNQLIDFNSDYTERFDLKQTGVLPPDSSNAAPYTPDWFDLVRLHQIVLKRKITTVLEFGVGYSTVILAHALLENSKKYATFVAANLRKDNPFLVFSVDANSDFIDYTQDLLPDELKAHVCFRHSGVQMAEWHGRICTLYDHLPNICPDLIYLDAPEPSQAKGFVRNITTSHPDRIPMSADILAIEHFLLPGTIILVDGRTANARFLQCNLQRNWEYHHSINDDVHYFGLKEQPLGTINQVEIEWRYGDPYWPQNHYNNFYELE